MYNIVENEYLKQLIIIIFFMIIIYYLIKYYDNKKKECGKEGKIKYKWIENKYLKKDLLKLRYKDKDSIFNRRNIL